MSRPYLLSYHPPSVPACLLCAAAVSTLGSCTCYSLSWLLGKQLAHAVWPGKLEKFAAEVSQQQHSWQAGGAGLRTPSAAPCMQCVASVPWHMSIGGHVSYGWAVRPCCCFHVQVSARRRDMLNYIVFLRVTPILPNTFINVASPIVGVPLAPFTLGG